MREILGSVLLITYYDQFVEECLKSYAESTIRDKLKLIMIDNGSKIDKTELFNKYKIEGDVFQRFEINKLQGKMNWALNCFGEGKVYTHLMDDDILTPDGLEKRLTPIIEGKAHAVYTNVEHFGDSAIEQRREREKTGHIWWGSVAYSSEAWKRIGGIDDEMRYQTDVLFMEQLKHLYGFYYVPEVTLLYRAHEGQESRTETKETRIKERQMAKDKFEAWRIKNEN
jgi:hypothetical protein